MGSPMATTRSRGKQARIPVAHAFNVVVERDEDGWLVGRVVELPGCHTQAKSIAELERRIREAIRLYLDVEGPPVASQFVGIHRVVVSA